MNYYLLKHKLLSVLGLGTDLLEAVAVESRTIAAAESQTVPAGIYLPSDLDRVTDTWHGSTIQDEIRLLKGGMIEHAASVAHRIRDVRVVDGSLYRGRWKRRLLVRHAGWFERTAEEKINSGVLACTWSGNYFFGHWLMDDLTAYLAAQEIGMPVVLNRELYPHEPDYRRIFDIPRNPIDCARIDDLVILEDFGQNDYKRRRYANLRKRLQLKTQCESKKRVLLRRGILGQSRSLINGPEVEAYLESEGFAILEPEKLRVAELIAKLIGAEVVVGVEGSNLFHALLTMAEGGTVCCLQPPNRFTVMIKGYTDCMGMRYAVVVGHPTERGFRIEIEDLKRVLEKIDKGAPAAALNSAESR